MKYRVFELLEAARRTGELSVVPFYKAGLTRSEAFIMMMVSSAVCDMDGPQGTEKHPLRASELAKALYVSPAAVSQVLTSLENRDLIIRVPSGQDKRIAQIMPTDAGLALADEVKSNCSQLDELLMDRLTSEEQQILHSLIQKLNSFADEEAAKTGFSPGRHRDRKETKCDRESDCSQLKEQ